MYELYFAYALHVDCEVGRIWLTLEADYHTSESDLKTVLLSFTLILNVVVCMTNLCQ